MAKLTPPPNEFQVRVIGGARTPFSDAYHVFLRWPWWGAILFIVLSYLLLNLLFALVYLGVGGIQGLTPGSLVEAFFFSVQTMGTIGYGSMYPTSRAANVVVVAQAVIGLLVTAVATGLVFSKFSQTRARIVFTRQAVISPVDGVPTLMLRLGNERSNRIVETQVRMVMFRTETTLEGKTLYRTYEVPLLRERFPALSRSWTLMSRIVAGNPLLGMTPETMKKQEVELIVTVSGMDDVSLQTVHAQHRYTDDQVVWGARHVDILSDGGDLVTLDLTRFHDTEPTPRSSDFPYPA